MVNTCQIAESTTNEGLTSILSARIRPAGRLQPQHNYTGTRPALTAYQPGINNPLRGVYAITDDKLLSEEQLLPSVEQALKGGISVLQYRSKSSDNAENSFAARRQRAASLVQLCHQYQAILLVNDDVDLCQAAGADGVHLGQSDVSAAEARYRLGPDAVIGVTCHNRDELVIAAEKQGADYIALGRFFPSLTKPHATAATVDDLKRIRQLTRLPIVAIGGVTADNGGELITAGADMLAVIYYLFSDDQVEPRAKALSRLFTHSSF